MTSSLSRHNSTSLVFTAEEVRALGHKVLGMTAADTVQISITHTRQQITRIANNAVLADDDSDLVEISVGTAFGGKTSVAVETNQVDDASLRAAVTQAEAIARVQDGAPWLLNPTPFGLQRYLPVDLWKMPTVDAFARRPAVAHEMIEPIRSAGFVAVGFVGRFARSNFVMNRDGLDAYYRETDCECNVTARSADGKASGWHGQAQRDWSRIAPAESARLAVDVVQRSVGMRALEPGRRTAILSPFAVAQLASEMTYAFNARSTDNRMTPFSKPPEGNKLRQRVFDPRITITSDPSDAEAGYRPDFFDGFPEPRMTWVENGILKNLSYDPIYALQKGKPYSGDPYSFMMSGGSTSIDEMISKCQEGIYVNRVSSVNLLNQFNGTLTGVTRDGCFFVKDGKIDRPVKNFRFTDSPWFFLNRIEALGAPIRAAFGYSPPKHLIMKDDPYNWPRRPMVVPPMMVHDFNFTALADAV